METPPPDAQTPVPPGPPERRCPRCGSTLAPDQEWCLSCGAAADTEVVEARGWRVPLYLGGGLAALAVIGVILAIVALARQDEVAQNPQASPAPSAQPPGASPSPLPTLTPAPSATAVPSATPTATEDPFASPSPEPTTEPSPEPTEDAGTDDFGTDVGGFPGWSIGDGYTVIIDSSTTQSGAEEFAQQASDAGETVGILNSDEFSSLNGGYWVVFSGEYTSKSEAEDALDALKGTYPDAYVRRIAQ